MTNDIDIDLSALAGAIIKLAVFDATWQPSRPATTKVAAMFHANCWRHRASALAFIAGSALDFWCDVAGVDAQRVRTAINNAIRSGVQHRDVGKAHRYPAARQRRAA